MVMEERLGELQADMPPMPHRQAQQVGVLLLGAVALPSLDVPRASCCRACVKVIL